MSTSPFDNSIEGEPSGFHSRDAEILISDGPGDNTSRPARPLLLRLGKVEQERIARWRRLSHQPPDSNQPEGPTNGPTNP
jgi:hypothetical protein